MAPSSERWLYHLRGRLDPTLPSHPISAFYEPPSLAAEGFVHASYQPSVVESARLYFAPGVALEVLQIDPRRLSVSVDIAQTPRGPMPHIHGPVPREAIVRVLSLEEAAAAPDVIER